jgi:hypothetical protein
MCIVQVKKRARARLAPATLLIALAVAGCTAQLAELAEPADAPAPAAATAYPAVHAMPAPRDTQPLSAAERQRIADELAALRERQEKETTSSVPAAKAPEDSQKR